MKHFNTHKPGRYSGYAEKPPRVPRERADVCRVNDAPPASEAPTLRQPAVTLELPLRSGTTTSASGEDAADETLST